MGFIYKNCNVFRFREIVSIKRTEEAVACEAAAQASTLLSGASISSIIPVPGDWRDLKNPEPAVMHNKAALRAALAAVAASDSVKNPNSSIQHVQRQAVGSRESI